MSVLVVFLKANIKHTLYLLKKKEEEEEKLGSYLLPSIQLVPLWIPKLLQNMFSIKFLVGADKHPAH